MNTAHSLQEITKALHASWAPETSYGGMATPKNPARGQCVVSSLVVQDFLGGELQRVRVEGDSVDEKHFFNVLDDGTRIDTTQSQYDRMKVQFTPLPIDLKGHATVRAKVLDDDTTRRYTLLRKRVDVYLAEKSV